MLRNTRTSQLLWLVMDELKGAGEYAECAARHKEDDPALFKTFHDIAVVALQHAELFLKRAKEHATRHHTMHPEMMTVYNFESEHLMRWHNSSISVVNCSEYVSK